MSEKLKNYLSELLKDNDISTLKVSTTYGLSVEVSLVPRKAQSNGQAKVSISNSTSNGVAHADLSF